MTRLRKQRRRRAAGVLVVAVAVAWSVHAADHLAARPPALDDVALREVVETGSRQGDEMRAWLVDGAPEAVTRGAEMYDLNCAVCHGDSGLGYDEARLAFPADHRTCTRCHRPSNVREMTFDMMNARPHDLFDVGVPPALRGPGALATLGSDDALLAYTRATMPRYQPGRLSDAAYADLVAFMRWIGDR